MSRLYYLDFVIQSLVGFCRDCRLGLLHHVRTVAAVDTRNETRLLNIQQIILLISMTSCFIPRSSGDVRRGLSLVIQDKTRRSVRLELMDVLDYTQVR